MKKMVGFLLVASLALYSSPLKGDSYSNILVQTEQSSDDEGCTVTGAPEVEAEATPSEQQEHIEQAPDSETYVDQGNYSDQETLVQPSNPEQGKRARNKRWQNILLAVAVVAAAVTALLLVNSHEGRKEHHHHH